MLDKDSDLLLPAILLYVALATYTVGIPGLALAYQVRQEEFIKTCPVPLTLDDCYQITLGN